MPHALHILHEVWQKSGKELPQGLKAFLHGFTRRPISSRLKIDSTEKQTRLFATGFKTVHGIASSAHVRSFCRGLPSNKGVKRMLDWHASMRPCVPLKMS